MSIVVKETLAAKLTVEPAPPRTNVSTFVTLVRARAGKAVTIKMSVPSPPSIVSAVVKLPAMLMVSIPRPPLMESLPAPLVRESLPAPPEMMSLPAPPVMVSKPPPPVTFKTRVDAAPEPSKFKFSLVRSVAAPEVKPPSKAAALTVTLAATAPAVMLMSRPAVAVVSPPSTMVIVSMPVT